MHIKDQAYLHRSHYPTMSKFSTSVIHNFYEKSITVRFQYGATVLTVLRAGGVLL